MNYQNALAEPLSKSAGMQRYLISATKVCEHGVTDGNMSKGFDEMRMLVAEAPEAPQI